jgi:hypothetical protein
MRLAVRNCYHTSEIHLHAFPLHKFQSNYCKYLCIDRVTERSSIFVEHTGPKSHILKSIIFVFS